MKGRATEAKAHIHHITNAALKRRSSTVARALCIRGRSRFAGILH
jgi:hypothetical protein